MCIIDILDMYFYFYCDSVLCPGVQKAILLCKDAEYLKYKPCNMWKKISLHFYIYFLNVKLSVISLLFILTINMFNFIDFEEIHTFQMPIDYAEHFLQCSMCIIGGDINMFKLNLWKLIS